MTLFYRTALSVCAAGMATAATLAWAAAPGAATTADVAVMELVQRYAQAQGSFDLSALRAATAEQFVEISPVGEVDSREKMLSFYAPEHQRPAPLLQIDEQAVRIVGDTALVTARLSYSINQGGVARAFALRGGYTARMVDGHWKLLSAQYTGIRPTKPQ